MQFSADAVSRLPEGSSANIIAGLFINARATATRCCSLRKFIMVQPVIIQESLIIFLASVSCFGLLAMNAGIYTRFLMQ
jgi:hypothetical protein